MPENYKIVCQLDAEGYLVGEAVAFENPIRPGRFLIPGGGNGPADSGGAGFQARAVERRRLGLRRAARADWNLTGLPPLRRRFAFTGYVIYSSPIVGLFFFAEGRLRC